MCKILSLDVSASSTGWCFTYDGLNFEKGTICTTAKLSRAERLLQYSTLLEELLLRLRPDFIVQEDTFSGNNVTTLKILSEFAGVTKLVCKKVLNIESYVIANATVKSYFSSSTKEILFYFVCYLLNINDLTFKKDNDMIDAQAQLMCYADTILNKYKYRYPKDYGYLYMEDQSDKIN